MDRAAILRSFPLLRGASEGCVQALLAVARWPTYSEGAPLWAAGDAASDVLLVRHGLVQVLRRLPSGEESTLALFGPREHIGLVAALEGGRYPADAVAVSELVEAVLVPTAAFRAAMDADPAIQRAATTGVVRRARSLHAKIEILTAGEIDRRLATLLLHLADRFGDSHDDVSTVVPLALTRRMLARLVGAREETVSRVLSRWEREDIVLTTGGTFVLKGLLDLQSVAGGG